MIPKRTVMVIDDDHDIRELLKLILEQEGYDVLVAGDGAEALRILRSGKKPDLIYLDLRMPVMNGWQFHEEQARDPNLAAIPTVIITADGAAIADYDFRWAQGVLAKPFSFDQILNVTSRHLPPPPPSRFDSSSSRSASAP